MKDRKVLKIILKYGISFIVAAGICLAVLAARGAFSMTERVDIYRALCDGFTVSGVLFLMFGLLMWVAELGTFDGISYAVVQLFRRMKLGRYRKGQSYSEYKEEKDKRRRNGWFGFMFVIGGIFTALAIIFLILFNTLR